MLMTDDRRRWALRNIAHAISTETDPYKFQTLSRWLVVYLEQMGVTR